MGVLARFRRCRSGTTAIEFAIVGMAFFMLSLGLIEFGRAFWIRNHISHAVDVGARTLLINAAATDLELEDSTRAAFVHGDQDVLQITITTEVSGGVTYRLIQAEYPLQLFVPGLSNPVITFDLERRIPVV